MPELFLQDINTVEEPSQVYSEPACTACTTLRNQLKGTGLHADMNGDVVDISVNGETIGTVTSAGVQGQYSYTPADNINGTGATDLNNIAPAIIKHYEDMYVYESANAFASAIKGKVSPKLFTAVMEGLIVSHGLSRDKIKMPLCEAIKGNMLFEDAESTETSMDYIPLEDVQQMLDAGVDLSQYITNNGIITLNDKCNVIRDGQLMSTQWFDYICAFENGFAQVDLNGKVNFIDTNGNLKSDLWFDDVEEFENGFAHVVLNDKLNFIDTNYNLLSEQWFDNAGSFRNGFAQVALNDKWNIIDTNGNLISDQWFDYIHSFGFENGFARVQLNGKWNFIDTNGKLLSDQWFDVVNDFRRDGYARVELNGKKNFIDPDGELLSDRWFDEAGGFKNGIVDVQLDGVRTFVDTNYNI